MSQVFRYVSPGTFNVDLGNQAVRLGEIPGFVTMAELGGVGTSTVVIDNPSGTVGHSSDQIVGWKQFQVTENAETAGNQRTYTGYITDRHYRRGTGPRTSILTAAGNEIEITLHDLNELLLFKVITGTDAVRPSETVSARTTWLMASTYLSGLVYDNGYIAASSVVMDATDYTGQQPAAVLADMALATHFNYFVYYDEAAGQASLWFDDSNTSANWDSGISISNDPADINQAAIVAGTASAFWYTYDAELHRDPTRCYSGVYLPYQKGHVYVTNSTIESNFVGRDGSAPNSNVKTAAAATVVGNLFLDDNQTEDDRITVTIQVAVAQANCILAGQLVQFKATHLPGYTTFQRMRVMQRSLAQSIETDEWYQMQLILSPASPTFPFTGSAFAAILNPYEPSAGVLGYQQQGDAPAGGWFAEPLIGPMAVLQSVAPFSQIKVTSAMTVRVELVATFSTVQAAGATVTLQATNNGVVIGSTTVTNPGSGFWAPNVSVDLHNITLAANDVISFAWTSSFGDPGWGNSGVNSMYLRVGRGTITMNSGSIIWIGP